MMARHMNISQVNERRLRPIYDYLDNGNNKKALQEAEKVLKKQKDLQCAKVLKALSLLRLGRQEESVSLLNEVYEESPTDDATLQAMTICYRELHKLELIAGAYERAVKKDPNNEELLSHLFMAYVRLGDYKKQQLTAMSLYKLMPKIPYYFWAVMSIYMQAIRSNDQNMALKVTLPLAEKMCNKSEQEGKMDAEAHVQLFVMILEKQEKYQEVLDIMDGPLGDKLDNSLDFLQRRKVQILMKLKRYKDAFDLMWSLIENNMDQIDYYLQMYELATLIDGQDSDSSLVALIKLIEKCKQKNAHVNKSNSKSLQRLRGPYIANLELFQLLKGHNETQGLQNLMKRLGNCTSDLLIEYYESFGSKHAFIYDMIYLIEKYNISRDEVDLLLINMKQDLLTLNGASKDVSAMQKSICFHYLSHYIGQHDSLTQEERVKLVVQLVNQYDEYFAGDVEINATETQPPDAFILLIGQVLLNSTDETVMNNNLILPLLVKFERALIKSPVNHSLKLFLMKIYNAIGAVGASHAILETLDVKHVQYDSLGYLIASPLITCAHFSLAIQLLGNSLRFYSANQKDTLDYLITCYRFGSFNKVEEIIQLREKLNNSVHYCSVAVERMILDLIIETKNHSSTETIISYMEIDPEKDKFICEELCDNRDLTVLRANHYKTDKLIEEKKKQTFEDEVLWLKIRNLLIRAIASAHYGVCNMKKCEEQSNVSNGSTSNGTDSYMSHVNVLGGLIATLKEYMAMMEKSPIMSSVLPIQGPQPSRIVLYSKSHHLKVLLSLLEYIHSLYSEPSEDSTTSVLLLSTLDYFAKMLSQIDELYNSLTNLFSLRKLLESFTECVDVLSLAVILVGVSQAIIKSKNVSKGKNKKKKEVSTSNDLFACQSVKSYSNFVNALEEKALQLKTIIKSIDIGKLMKPNEGKFDSNSDYLLSETAYAETLAKVRGKCEKSYLQSLKELGDLLQNKITYIQSLKF